MEINGIRLGEQASQKIIETLKNPRKASKEMKEYLKEAIEVSKNIKKK